MTPPLLSIIEGSNSTVIASRGFFLPLRDHLDRHKRLYTYILILYVLFFLFTFHRIVFAIPSILGGEKVLSSDELVPFFDFPSQFVDQLFHPFNKLTNGAEFRVRYSFFTTWLRYWAVLP